MKKLLSVLMALVLSLLIAVPAFATDVGTGIGINMETEQFPPRVWLCDSRVVHDDNVQKGRLNRPGDPDVLRERINNYAFEGEQITWDVVVFDKNGVPEKIKDVYVTLGSGQGEGNDIEANCQFRKTITTVPEECNARILEEELYSIEPGLAAIYTCTLTVETPDSLNGYGQYWVTIEAEDLDGLQGTMDENEYWFFNPVISLHIDGTLDFGVVRPGALSYSDTLLVGNDADVSSGVLLDMFITGTDFYDPSSSGAKCPTTNQLSLSNFRYYVVNGAYSSVDDEECDPEFTTDPENQVDRDLDNEGYLNIEYGDNFDTTLYNNAEVLQAAGPPGCPNPLVFWPANILAPGAEMALTFRLDLPEPCNGDFSSGSIFFWGEAI